MATRIYTRTGDQGDTGLLRGGRVRKDHCRVEAYGAVDELNAALGLARALGVGASLESLLAEVQDLLFELGAELATAPDGAPRAGVVEADVVRLERAIDEAEAQLPPLTHFIQPAGVPAAAALHQARTVCRRAERRVVALRTSEPQTPVITVTFLNRLGDLLFVLARLANHDAGRADILWRPRPQ